MAPFLRLARLHVYLWSLIFFTLTLSTTNSQRTSVSEEPSYYYNLCAPSTCGNFSLQYPFALSKPCQLLDQETFCVNNENVLLATPGGSDRMRMVSINYTDPAVSSFFVAPDSLFTCGAQFSRPNYRNRASFFKLPAIYTMGTYLNCTAPLPHDLFQGLQNASCLSCSSGEPSNKYVCYYARGFVDPPPNCENHDMFTPGDPFNATSLGSNLRGYLQRGFELKFDIPAQCRGCEVSGGRCGANPLSGSFVCYCPSSVHRMNCSEDMVENLSTWVNGQHKKLSQLSAKGFTEIIVPASVLLVGLFVVAFVCKRKSNFDLSEEKISSISLTRYSYSKLKKLTNNFLTKLGEGGFGHVYKGTIKRSGSEIPIAVKVLKKSKQTKKQFMNEVKTTGSIHHLNLVSMLGYCISGETHALVYEFLENGSLEKYIYSGKIVNKLTVENTCLSFQQVYRIALETARGLLYLHNGCYMKILHCDIKPSNILLDSDFSAKLADFGIAKMINKDYSHVSVTTAQGTPGYAAPEMWLKSLGPITDKSDVYSYGMLLLELVGRRKNYDAEAPCSSQIYFPEWLYNEVRGTDSATLARRLGKSDSIEIVSEQETRNEEDDKSLRRLCLLALWCIQYSPLIRPSMIEVVQMLEGHVEISLPPHPFPQNKSDSHGDAH